MVMPTMTYTHERIGKASWVRMTSPSVEVKNISKNTKMRLYTSIVIASAMYASETWRTTDKTNRMFNVFNRRWHNGSVMEGPRDKWRTSIKCLQDIVADRRRRFIGHVLRLPTSRPASLVIDWTPEGGSRRWGRPKRTWQDTCREDNARNGCQWQLTLMKPGALPVIVLNGDNSSSPSVPAAGTGGPKSK